MGLDVTFSAFMRVVICSNTAWSLYNFRAGLIRSLLAHGMEVVAVAPPDSKHATLLTGLGCRFEPMPMDNKGTSPVADALLTARFARLFRRLKPDWFLGYTIKPNVYGSLAARLFGIPVINNVSGLGTAFIRHGWLTRVVSALYRVTLGSSRTVFFQNPDDLSLFVDAGLVRREQARLLPGSGIDLQRFAPVATGLRRESEGPVFLLIARLLWDKGVGEYVEAARLVRAKLPEARFQLLGFLDVENRTAVPRADVDAWGREGLVDYLGAAEDVRASIAAADCVVLPSYREGTPRSLLEAAAMAKPLLATDVPGCRTVVDDGVNGFLCSARDPKALADAMIRFAKLDPQARQLMGDASRAKMEREFDENIVIDAYLDALAR